MQLLQQSVWIFLGGALLAGIAWNIALGYEESAETLVGLALRIIALGTTGAVNGVAVAVCTIRERALFAYFQNRS